MTRTALYRHFDADGALLYIGISADPANRLREHIKAGKWPAARVDLTWFDTRADAEDAERAAIVNEAPTHNARHNRHPGSLVASVLEVLDADEICRRLKIKPRSIRLARERGVFPASWYPVMRDICAARDVECPLSAFNWKSPDTPAQAEAS